MLSSYFVSLLRYDGCLSQYFAFKDFSEESILVELCAGSEDLILCNKHSCIHFCFSIDGTFSSQLGKFINHSSRHVNCVAKPVKRGNDVYLPFCHPKHTNRNWITLRLWDSGPWLTKGKKSFSFVKWSLLKILLQLQVCRRYYWSCKSDDRYENYMK